MKCLVAFHPHPSCETSSASHPSPHLSIVIPVFCCCGHVGHILTTVAVAVAAAEEEEVGRGEGRGGGGEEVAVAVAQWDRERE